MCEFTAVQVLNITSGVLCSEIGDVYEVLSYMFQKEMYTYQLPIASRPCSAKLLELYPQFSELGDKVKVQCEFGDEFVAKIQPILAGFIAQHGNSFSVPILNYSESDVFLDRLIEKKMRQGRLLTVDPNDPLTAERIILELGLLEE